MKRVLIFGASICVAVHAGDFKQSKEAAQGAAENIPAMNQLLAKKPGHTRNSSRSCSDLMESPHGTALKKIRDTQKERRQSTWYIHDEKPQPVQSNDQEEHNKETIALSSDLRILLAQRAIKDLDRQIIDAQIKKNFKDISIDLLHAQKEMLEKEKVIAKDPGTKNCSSLILLMMEHINQELDDAVSRLIERSKYEDQ